VPGCGSPEDLSREDAATLANARERLDDAIDTEETLRTSRAEARRLRARVREIVARGAFESEQPDEFGLAALGELREVVPSLVLTGRQDVPRALDRPATDAFLRFALSDPRRATVAPARRQVDRMEKVVENSGAGPDTKIPGTRSTVSRYLRGVARDTSPIWPGLGRRLRALRESL
jgi:hypothetical protein